MTDKSLCFGTLALGSIYRAHAQMLAIDLEEMAPKTEFLVLTDKIKDFLGHPNVYAVKFKQDALRVPYHDKRFVLREGLERHETCVFLDADMRVLDPVPDDLNEQLMPGISTYFCSPWNQWAADHENHLTEIDLVRKAASALNIDISECIFVLEQVIAVKRHELRHYTFLDAWDRLARHFQQKKLHHGEGHAIGMAAAVAGLKIQQFRMLGDSLFKDMWIRHGLEDTKLSTVKQLCYREHKFITEMSRNTVETKTNQIRNIVRRHFYRHFPLRGWKTLD